MDSIQYSGKLTVYETNIAKDLVEVLKPFEWATNMVQGQNKVTSSVVIPVVRALRNEIDNLSTKFKMKILTTLKESVDTRLTVYEKELAFQLASALDPRWKLAWCHTPEEATSLRRNVHQKVLAIAPPSTPLPESSPAADSPPPQKRSCYFNFMKDTQSVSCEANIES